MRIRKIVATERIINLSARECYSEEEHKIYHGYFEKIIPADETKSDYDLVVDFENEHPEMANWRLKIEYIEV